VEIRGNQYDLLLGTSMGSLLIPHLALVEISTIYDIYTTVNKHPNFNVSPFLIKKKNGVDIIIVNYLNVIKQFFKGKRTFGESRRLLKYIRSNFTLAEFNLLKVPNCSIIVTVINLAISPVE
jgi:NTE family protein